MHFNQVAKHHRPDVFWGARVNDAPGNNSNPSESLEICSATDHLTSMSGVVAANAIDAQHREHHQHQPPELRTKPGAGTDYFSLPVARLHR